MTLEWTEFVAVDNARIDRSNRNLVNVVNRLEAIRSGSPNRRALEDILCELADYITGQFDFEEFQMDRCRYPGADRHKTEHQLFIRMLTVIITNYEKSEATVVDDTLSLLMGWLRDHVFGEDIDFWRYLRQWTETEAAYADAIGDDGAGRRHRYNWRLAR